MENELEPIIGNWYMHLDKGQRFEVVAVDEANALVELQHFDGDLEEVSLAEWREMNIAFSEEPQNWTGPVDIGEVDDLGTAVTDTTTEDWAEPLGQYRDHEQERLLQEQQEVNEEWDEEVPAEASFSDEKEK
jgi:hypothetical protein